MNGIGILGAHVAVSTPDPQTIKVTSVIDGVRSGAFSQSLLTNDVYQTYGDRAIGHYFICAKGFVRLARQYNFGSAIPGVINLSSDFLWLRRATDGSLIVLCTGTARARSLSWFLSARQEQFGTGSHRSNHRVSRLLRS